MSIVAVVLTGCEKELGFDEGGENLNVIAISMVASPDTTLEAIVARTYRTGVVGTEGTDVEQTFLKAATLRFATVTYSVNGASPVEMVYDAEHCRFRSDYRPKAGDVIAVSASEQNFPSVSANFTMPTVAPTVEIVRTRKYRQDHLLDQLETGYFDGGQDTVVDISLRMKGLEPSRAITVSTCAASRRRLSTARRCMTPMIVIIPTILCFRISGCRSPAKDGIRISATCLPARLSVAQDMSAR